MSGILEYGITESVFVAVDILSPKLAVLSSVYPAFVEFGLDDEYAILGYYYMLPRIWATRCSPIRPFDLRSQKPRKMKMAIMTRVSIIVRYFDYLCKCT